MYTCLVINRVSRISKAAGEGGKAKMPILNQSFSDIPSFVGHDSQHLTFHQKLVLPC